MENLLVTDNDDVVYTGIGNVRLNIDSSSICQNVGAADDGRTSTDKIILSIQSGVLLLNIDGCI